MHDRRVVVTGIGVITPLGCTIASFWDGLVCGRSGIAPITLFDTSKFDVRFGGECRDFRAGDYLEHRHIKRLDRFTQFACAAAKLAWADSGLTEGAFEPNRAGAIIGSGIGGLLEIEEQHRRLAERGPGKVSPFTIPRLMANATCGNVSIMYNLRGPSAAVATACASAGHAMADALYAIRRGDADVMVTGGSEAALTPLALAAFASMKAVSTRNDDPTKASRPFDKDRDGFVLSEGAGILIFEEFEFARRRGANIICEVAGVGATSDAGDIVQPDANGDGPSRAMSLSLKDAGVDPAEVDYINAHATSTPLGDVAETNALKRVFGASAKTVAVSSTKGSTGHLLGATGAIEATACALAIRNNTLPPTINLDNVDTDCDLNHVRIHARDGRVKIAMSNSFGFGGHNACVVLRAI
ncbi:MAG: beta-ketoacyl-ACP synthase II [Phycisphaerales bacterium]|nr:beta-ketoacyl-ACP synthase II [Phycisphaerales bacterium]